MMSEQLRTLAMFMNKFPQSINRYMENNFVLLGYFRAHTVILTVSDDKIEACQLCGSRHTSISTPSHSQCFLFSYPYHHHHHHHRDHVNCVTDDTPQSAPCPIDSLSNSVRFCLLHMFPKWRWENENLMRTWQLRELINDFLILS